MPRREERIQRQPMTDAEIVTMNEGTDEVTHQNGSKWLAWKTSRGFCAKWVSGPLPPPTPSQVVGASMMGTPVQMNEEKFKETFNVA